MLGLFIHFWPKLSKLQCSKVDSFQSPPLPTLELHDFVAAAAVMPKKLLLPSSKQTLLAFSCTDSGLLSREATLCTASLNTFQHCLVIDCCTFFLLLQKLHFKHVVGIAGVVTWSPPWDWQFTQVQPCPSKISSIFRQRLVWTCFAGCRVRSERNGLTHLDNGIA